MLRHRNFGLVPAPEPHAREYKRAVIALATATAFKLTFFVWYFTRAEAVLYVWLFGVLVFDLLFRAVATHSHIKSGGASLGAIAVFTNFFAVASVIYWFDEDAVLLTMFVTTLSVLLGSAGTLLLFRSLWREEQRETFSTDR